LVTHHESDAGQPRPDEPWVADPVGVRRTSGKASFQRTRPDYYARDNRVEILAELAGFVVRWNQQGRPEGTRSHRCHHWAKIIGGILEANGFQGFLANYEEASQSFNSDMEDLASLLDAVMAQPNGPFVVVEPTENEK